MLTLTVDTPVFLSRGATDMRKGSYSLARMVEECFKRDSLDGAIYVFLSRDRKKVKILHWESDGYWLMYKRLATSTFRVKIDEEGREELTGIDLKKLLAGVDFKRIDLKRKVEKSLSIPH